MILPRDGYFIGEIDYHHFENFSPSYKRHLN